MKSLAFMALLSACTSPYEPFEMEKITIIGDLDILIVIDDRMPPVNRDVVSYVMSSDRFARWMINWTQSMSNIRVAVTTTTTGRLQKSSLIPTGVIEYSIDTVTGTPLANYGDGHMSDAFDTLLPYERTSTATNTVLESTVNALEDSPYGFGRGALGILVISAGDDESPRALEEYASLIQGHGDAVMMTALTPGTPRLGEFASLLEHSYFPTLGTYEQYATIGVFADMFDTSWVPSGPIDCFPLAPASDDSCQVFASDLSTHALEPCTSQYPQDRMCYRLIDSAGCPTGYELRAEGTYASGRGRHRPKLFGGCFVE